VCQATDSLATSGCLRRKIAHIRWPLDRLLIGKFSQFDRGLCLFTETAVENRKLIMRSEVVRIDCLQLLVGIARPGIVVLLVVAEAQLAQSSLKRGVPGNAGLQVGDGLQDLPSLAFDDRAVVESAWIAGKSVRAFSRLGLASS